MRTLTFTLGGMLVAYCFAGILSETLWLNNERVDKVLCRLLLCDDARQESRARRQLTGVTEDSRQKAISLFQEILQRNPHDAYRWADLGEAFLEAGKKEQARYCFGQVAFLAPRSANLLLRTANFYFQIGENNNALAMTAKILGLIPDYDSVIFSEYTRLVERTDDVLQYGFPQDHRAAQSWLRFLIQEKRLNDAQRSWDWLVSRGFCDDPLAGEYANFLIRQGRPDIAASAWTQHLGLRSGNYRKSNYLFNASFESDPVQSPFDWEATNTQGVEVIRDCSTASSGKCSLRIHFLGTQNVAFAAASQLALVKSGSYCFHGFIRTDHLTTDQGLRFHISDAELPSRLDLVFGQYNGSIPWSSVEQSVAVAVQTRLLQIQIIRQPSMKFDNKVGGTAWIDGLRLEPNSGTCS